MMFSDVSKYQIAFPALSQACNANFFSEKKKALPVNLPPSVNRKITANQDSCEENKPSKRLSFWPERGTVPGLKQSSEVRHGGSRFAHSSRALGRVRSSLRWAIPVQVLICPWVLILEWNNMNSGSLEVILNFFKEQCFPHKTEEKYMKRKSKPYASQLHFTVSAKLVRCFSEWRPDDQLHWGQGQAEGVAQFP